MAHQVDESNDGSAVAVAPVRAATRLARWRWRALLGVLCIAYLGIWGASGAFPIGTTDLEAFFLPSARLILTGHLAQAYTVRYAGYYPNANGPFSLLPLTLASAVAQHFGVLDMPNPRRAIVMAIFAVFPLLVSYEAVRAVDRLRGVALRGFPRLGAYATFALTPQLWHSMLFYGHIEQPLELWLALLGIRLLTERRALWAGICLGLMLLTRSSSLVLLLPLLVVLLCRGRWRDAVHVGGVAAAVVVLGVLPFWLGDRADTVYSLVTFRDQLPVGGGSVWGLALGTSLAPFAQSYDSWVVIGAVTLIALVAALRWRTLDIGSRELYALLTVTSLCFPLLIKTMWPYYFLEPYIFVALWWLACLPVARGWARRRWLWWAGAALPVAVFGLSLLGAIGAGAIETYAFIHAWSADMSLGMVLLMAIVATFGLVRVPRAERETPAGSDPVTLETGYTVGAGG